MARKKSDKAAADGPSHTAQQLPERLAERHDYVTSSADMNFHTSTQTSASVYMPLGVDNSWSEEDFDAGFSISVAEPEELLPHDLEFDIKGIDPAITNALRRILISDVPTVAIEHVFFVNNTSIIADEVLAHRLGMVPMNVDPRRIDFKSAQVGPSEKNTVVFRLRIDCKWKVGMGGDIVHDKVLSKHLEYLPGGSEMPDETSTSFSCSQEGVLPQGASAMDDDVLLAKMRPGQSIDLEAHCIKGLGSEHAKWSPVATAWYRLHPELVILKPITGAMADEIVELCSHPTKCALFSLEGTGKSRTAVSAEARGNEHHLEKVRRLLLEDRWKEHLHLRKRKDHFIFTIQSTGALAPEELFLQSIDILSAKCDKLLEQL